MYQDYYYHLDWGPQEVGQYIADLGYPAYAEVFVAENVTGYDLHDLNHEILEKFGERNAILKSIPYLT